MALQFGDITFHVGNFYEFIVLNSDKARIVACYENGSLRLFRCEYQDKVFTDYWCNVARYTLLDAMNWYQEYTSS